MTPRDDSPAEKMTKDIQERLSLWRELETRLGEQSAKDPGAPHLEMEKAKGLRGLISRLGARKNEELRRRLREARRDSSPSSVLLPASTSFMADLSLSSAHGPLFNETICLTRTKGSTSFSGLELRSLAGSEVPWREPSAWSGRVLEGRYAIEGLLAQGGTSLVFHGLDRERQRPVAVKILPPGLRAMVEESHALTRRLEHPSILPVVSSGRAEGGGLFQVLPLLRGLPLKSLLDSDSAPPGPLLLAFRRACEGIAHAHGRGILHRDLKPSNILIEPDAAAVVVDWDLACASHTASSGGKLRFGTPLYMAPEQFREERLGPPADVYALGLILYEVLTGVHPSGWSQGLKEIAHRTLNEMPPPPSFINSEAPRSLDEVTLRCLRKDPGQRYATAGELLEAVEEAGLA